VRFHKNVFSALTTYLLFQNVWASTASSEVNEKFSSNVTAEYNGITAGGNFDASVESESQYKTFTEYVQKLVSVQGGDINLAINIVSNPTVYANYDAWTKTILLRPDLMNFQTVEIWSLMKDASSSHLRQIANTIQDAFNYIVTHPQPYSTAVSLSIQSDWCEFGLLTPSAIIIPNKDIPFPDPGNTVQSETKILWGKEYSHDQRRQTIEYVLFSFVIKVLAAQWT
jgi:hypothetical protein